MPIKGLTEPERQRLPRLGKLRTGKLVQVGTPKQHPIALDYFTTGENTPRELDEAFRRTFGDEPTVISPVYVPVEDVEQFANTAYRAYTRSRGLVCKGDGERADRLVDRDVYDETGEPEVPNADTKHTERMAVPCPCPMLDQGQCKAMMMLQLVVPSLPGVGIWQVDTGSINSIKNVLGCVNAIRMVTGGPIVGVPLELRLTKKDVTPDGATKKRVNVLELSVKPDEYAAAIAERAGKPMFALPAGAILPEADDEPPDESIIPTQEEVAESRRRALPVNLEQLVALRQLRESVGVTFEEVRDWVVKRGVNGPADWTLGVYEDCCRWLLERGEAPEATAERESGGLAPAAEERTTEDKQTAAERAMREAQDAADGAERSARMELGDG